jgi:acyl-CoA thioesterase-2
MPITSSLAALLELEQVEEDLFRSRFVSDEQHHLYGGQVAAQALWAAGRTVVGREPHSLHGYFLRAGDPTRPIVYRVERDRDGRSYSARRVVAIQDGEVLLNLSCSFHSAESGQDEQVPQAPDVERPEELPSFSIPLMVGIECRVPTPPYPIHTGPTRLWARCDEGLPDDPTMHGCVLTYLSDIGTGLWGLAGSQQRAGSSLDHAVWFHRQAHLDDWVLMDLVPVTVSRGRGWYTGSVVDRDGVLLASLTQETLYRDPR